MEVLYDIVKLALHDLMIYIKYNNTDTGFRHGTGIASICKSDGL